MGDTVFQLKHVSTGQLLYCDRKYEYNQSNCPRCPIVEQLEATTDRNGSTKSTKWRIDSGMFFPTAEGHVGSDY